MRTDNPDDSGSMKPDRIHQSNQSGGVNVFGGKNTFKGDVTGRDKIVYSPVSGLSEEAFLQLFKPLDQAIQDAPPEQKAQAEEKVATLKEELAKGDDTDDSRVAKLLDGIAELVPGAVSALVGMFADPILAGLVGPVTKFVLGKFS